MSSPLDRRLDDVRHRPADVDPCTERHQLRQSVDFCRIPNGADVRHQADVEKACEVAGVLALEDWRPGTFDGGKRVVEARKLVSRDVIARRPLLGNALHGTS